jgi:serine/threonine-protein kinase
MSETLPAGTVIAGRYELQRLLGAGGAGRVYAAIDTRLDRRVAIKLVSADQAESNDPASTARFVAEARTGALFTHPNAVTVFDAGSSDGYLYLVTELVDGANLAQHLDAHGALDVDHAVRVADQILGALAAAHAAGIVHRDVKPSNVLLDTEGNGKLADFGIAKRLDDVESSFTADGHFVGTPRYASPEQAAGRPATAATDVYAAGVVLFEMLTGRPLYEGDEPVAVAIAHQTAPIPDLEAIRPDVPAALGSVVRKALAKSPSDRYPDAGALRRALSGAVSTPSASVRARDTRTYPSSPLATTAVQQQTGPSADDRLLAMSAAVPDRGGAWRRPLWLWAALGGLVAVVLAVAVLVAREDPGASDQTLDRANAADPTRSTAATPTTVPARTGPPATTPPATVPTTTQSPTTTAPPETATLPPATPPPLGNPVDLASLIGFIEQSAGVGSRQGDLLAELRGVAESSGLDQRQVAHDAAKQIHDWAKQDEVEVTIANFSIEILNDIIRPANEPDHKGDGKKDGEGSD